jgi:ATP synthase protein I
MTKLRQKIQNQAYSLVLWQLACVFGISLIALILSGKLSGMSVLVGGLAYGLPNLFFVAIVFQFTGAQQMTQFMAAFYAGEMFKLILSGILFVLVVKYLPVSLLSVVIGFVGAIVSFWIVSIWHFSKGSNA